MIDKTKIMDFLNSWTAGVIEIGQLYIDDQDYVRCAESFISRHYAFGEVEVLFKPTFTKDVIFRNTQLEALSYFVKGQIKEDNGFALKPWEKIDLDECHMVQEEENTSVMGTLLFKPQGIDELTKVAFTFLLIEIEESIKIKVHHSSPVL